MEDVKQVIATRAIIIKDKKILLIRESDKKYADSARDGWYDVPGGRLDVGEDIEVGVRREAKEEAGLDVQIQKPYFVGEWRPEVRDTKLQIIGIFFLCTTEQYDVELGDEHDDYQWVGRDELSTIQIVPPVPEVIDRLIMDGLL